MPAQKPYELEIPFHNIDTVQLAANAAAMTASQPKPRQSLHSIDQLLHQRNILVARIAERGALRDEAATQIVELEKGTKEQAKKLKKIEKLIASSKDRPGVRQFQKEQSNQQYRYEQMLENKAGWERSYKVHCAIVESTKKQLATFDETEGPNLAALIEERDLLDNI
jgi:ClpP class serine protease